MGAHTDSSSTLEGDVGGDLNVRGSLGYLVRLCLRKQTKVGCLTFSSFLRFCLHVYDGACAPDCMLWSEANFLESVLSFHLVEGIKLRPLG